MKATGTTLSLITIFALSAQLCLAVTDLYVSPKGDDSNPGTKRRPFSTLHRAQKAVRELTSGQKSEGVTVHLKKGRHFLNEQLRFTPADSGSSAKAPVIWKGEKGVSISGGKPLTHWKRAGENLWKTKVEWLGNDDLFYSLFADGKRMTRARTPNTGTYSYTKKLIYDKKNNKVCTGMYYTPNTIPDDIETPDAHIVLFHKWVTSQNFVKTIDPDKNTIMFKQPAGIFLFDPNARFYVEGVRSALDTPGEWFLDPASKELLLVTEKGENPNNMQIFAPALETALLVLNGSTETGEAVRHLVFEDITFEHVDANLTQSHPRSVQGAHKQRGAITAEGMHDSVIRNCTFTHIGENGICLLNGCQGNIIEQNHIYDMGCGGIYMPEEKPGKLTSTNRCGHNVVQDNLIHDGGIIFRAGVGVFMAGNASHNRILHNEIFNMSWAGIHAGWSWNGLSQTATHHNDIGFNHIHHIGNGVLCDIGGIYTLGLSTGTVLHNNLIHDITRYTRGRTGYGAWGLYNDAGSSQITLTSNVVYNTQDGGYHLHNDNFPWGDKAYNNIFAISKSAQLIRGNIDDTTNGLHIVFENNIVYCTNNLAYGGHNWKTNSAFSCDYNCFYSTSDQPLDFAGYNFETWQKAGKDTHSMIANPMFRDIAKHDFRIDPKSPAITLGFKPFDYTLAGLSKGNPLRKQIKKITLRPVEVAPTNDRPFKLDDNFEEYEEGTAPTASYKTQNIGNRGFIITKEKSASGRQSLKVADTPDFRYSYDPHICYHLPERDGTWKVSFDLLHAKGSSIIFETRDYNAGSHYKSGMSIRINKDGTANANGQKFQIKPGEWSKFELTFTQGAGTWPTWGLKVNAGKADESSFTCMPASPGFIKLTWIGFISPDKSDGVYYLDNMKAEMAE